MPPHTLETKHTNSLSFHIPLIKPSRQNLLRKYENNKCECSFLLNLLEAQTAGELITHMSVQFHIQLSWTFLLISN